jgi:hypothetical protein
MKKNFSDMTVGECFVVGEVDEFYQDGYKLSETEAWVNECGAQRAGRKQLSGEFEVTGKTVDVHATVTDIECVALTLVNDGQTIHPVLSEWKQAVLSNPDEMRTLDEFAWDNRDMEVNNEFTLKGICDHYGYAFPRRKYDRDIHLFCLIWDHQPAGEYTYDSIVSKEYRNNGGSFDAALMALLDAVVDYRQRGRVSGENTTTINGLGGPLLNVTTSLAAAIVEYHHRYINNVLLREDLMKQGGA